jgi:hypothetical protein
MQALFKNFFVRIHIHDGGDPVQQCAPPPFPLLPPSMWGATNFKHMSQNYTQLRIFRLAVFVCLFVLLFFRFQVWLIFFLLHSYFDFNLQDMFGFVVIIFQGGNKWNYLYYVYICIDNPDFISFPPKKILPNKT